MTPWLLAPALILGGVLGVFQREDTREARSALDAYRDGNYEAAAERFARAREVEPDPRLDFNLGVARYRAGSGEDALRSFRSARRDPALAANAAFNLGNAHVQAGDLEGALVAYREALRLDPGDDDARFNYEWVWRQRQQQEQNQEQESQPDENQEGEPGEDGDRQDAPPDSSGQGEPGEPGEGDSDPGDPDSTGTPPPSPADSTAADPPDTTSGEPREPQPGQLLSPEEAARLLNAVSAEERELLEARLKAARRRAVEKDW